MYLQEEYLKRHGIENIPFVVHTRDGYFLFRLDKSTNASPFLLVHIEWCDNSSHPGMYRISYGRPLHDGYFKNKYFEEYDSRILNWDDYQIYMTNFTSGLSDLALTPIMKKEDIYFSLWEIFLSCFDGWIVSLHDGKLIGMISNTVHFKKFRNFKYYKEVFVYLKNNYPDIYEIFQSEFLFPVLENYCYWLGNMVNYFKNNVRLLEVQ